MDVNTSDGGGGDDVGAAGNDASIHDGAVEGAADGAATEAGKDADSGPSPVTGFHDITDPANWSTFTLGQDGFAGAVFDGRYVYLVPATYDVGIERYDTQASFQDPASYATSATAPQNQFFGGTFDGRYLYLSPYSGSAARYDTTQAFDAAGSWSQFDTSTIPGQGAGLFRGAVYDGRYVYFVPFSGTGVPYSGNVARYDTMAGPFSSVSSWSTFDTSTLPGAPAYFEGGTFDGRYVYFLSADLHTNHYIVRLDTQGPFTTAASWQAMDLTTLSGVDSVSSYNQVIFDGRYLYLAPNNANPLRFDTTASFTDPTSWQASPAGYNTGFEAFDGRYIYIMPLDYSDSSAPITRYDTTADFTDTAAWESYTLTVPVGEQAGWVSGAFDGRYLYLAPNLTHEFVRFDALYPPATPPGYHGSFL